MRPTIDPLYNIIPRRMTPPRDDIKYQEDTMTEKNNTSTVILWVVCLTIGGGCSFMGLLNRAITSYAYAGMLEIVMYIVVTFLFFALVPAAILFSGRWVYRKLFT